MMIVLFVLCLLPVLDIKVTKDKLLYSVNISRCIVQVVHMVKIHLTTKKLLCSRFLARACGVPVSRRSGGRLAMTLVATINVILFFSFFFFFLSSTFLIEGVLGSKNLFRES